MIATHDNDLFEPLTARKWVLALCGLVLPFIELVWGWSIADRVLGSDADDAQWDRAGTWIYLGTLVIAVPALLLCRPFVLSIRGPALITLFIVTAVAYLPLLFFVNFLAYFQTNGPFP